MNLQPISNLVNEFYETTHESFPYPWAGVAIYQGLLENA